MTTRLEEVRAAMTEFLDQAKQGLHSRSTCLHQIDLLLQAAAEIELDGYARGYDQALIDEVE